MKKILLFVLLPFLAVNLCGGVNANTAANSITPNRDSDQLTVEFEATDAYISGTTMDINFVLTFSSSLGDQADYFELTFPDGMTPTGGTAVLSYVNPINPINGQVVSWGSDHNNTGQFSILAGTYNIFVTLDIDASVSGDQEVAYLLSPRYFGYPDVTGIAIVMQDAPALTAPENLLAEIQDENDVLLSWELPGDATFENFNIYRNVDLIASPTETSYIDEGLPNGDFEYYVTAVYTEGESEASNTVDVIIAVDPWEINPTGVVHSIQVPASVNPNIFGSNLATGDWVGVFYINDEGVEVCGGAGAIQPFGNTVVNAYGDDNTTPDKDGFADGEMFRWRMYDMSEMDEYHAMAEYDPESPNQEFFANMGLSKLTALDAIEFLQSFVLAEGWNSFSSHIIPQDPDIENMLSSLGDDLVIFRNLTQVYWPEAGFNSIGDYNNNSGFVTKLNANVNLQLLGSGDAGRELSLENAGWYYLPVLSACPVNIENIFGTQIADVIIIQELIGTGIYWPDMSIYTLQDLMPGKAYSIKISAPVDITFPECSLKSGYVQLVETNSQNTPWGEISFTPFRQVSVVMPTAMKYLQPGDEMGAFDAQGNVCGYAVVQNTNNKLPIVLFGDDNTLIDQHGFRENDEIIFKLYRSETGEESEISPVYSSVFDNTSGLFRTNSFAAINSMELKNSIDDDISEVTVSLFPNPATDRVTLNISGNLSVDANVEIFDVNGRLVYTGNSGPSHIIDVTSFNRGVYYVKILTAQNTMVKKMMLD